MKQTVNINLGGIVFHIDEDAYTTLETYLSKVSNNLQSDIKEEIMQDIEARIAELFQQHLQYSKMEVVNLPMVNDIMQQLGSPEAIGAETDESATADQQPSDQDAQEVEAEEVNATANEKKACKKLYRDIEHQVIGGVCAGLAERMGVDAVVIRIAFVLLLLLQGAGLMAYLLLWIIMPAANTAARRLEMRGIDPSAENIQKEVERTQDERAANPNKGQRSAGGNVMMGCLIAFAILLGLPILFVFFILLTVFGSLAFAGASVAGGLLGLPLTGLSFGGLTAGCGILIVLIPIVILIIWLINRKKNPQWMGKSFWILAFVLWVLSLIGFSSGIYKTYSSISNNREQWTQFKDNIDKLSENKEALDAFEEAMDAWGEQLDSIMESNANQVDAIMDALDAAQDSIDKSLGTVGI